jgi:putative serine protease PepD
MASTPQNGQRLAQWTIPRPAEQEAAAPVGSGREPGTSAGTGIILSGGGEVLTNAHVVDGTQTITVTLAGQKVAHPATLVGENVAADLALLQIVGVRGLPAAPLGRSADVRVGDDVVAIGNALALTGGPTVTRGIVSALGRSLTTETGSLTGLIQTAENIGFAIPIDRAMTVAAQLRGGQPGT